ncbi:hypothetical protein GALMADRAFT_506786 [Galerina marginata CBS 339.88]|uniref:Thioredoxin domain-containing protein n=1 Tax=Galerina marginata (strain CBS 339.88) TaxID=685588 RepID=A0A067T0H2_GALM3|nr:hypothetical protein GALMADRAFT_506786 [Galerina marginata CBS 339.88]
MSSIIPNAQSLTEIISLPKESVIYFHIKNCRFCSTVGPVFETIASVRAATFEGVTLGRFNMTEHRETVEKLGVKDEITEKLRVKTFPTIVIYQAGGELSRIVGSHSQAEFEEWLMKSLRNRYVNHSSQEQVDDT